MESSPSASRRGAREQAAPVWRAALYTRLSREDGDKPESDSISNQRALLEDFLSRRPDLCPAGWYADDCCRSKTSLTSNTPGTSPEK